MQAGGSLPRGLVMVRDVLTGKSAAAQHLPGAPRVFSRVVGIHFFLHGRSSTACLVLYDCHVRSSFFAGFASEYAGIDYSCHAPDDVSPSHTLDLFSFHGSMVN